MPIQKRKKNKVVKKLTKAKPKKKSPSRKKTVGKTKKPRALSLKRSLENPIINPTPGSHWESEAVFNPGTVVHNGRVHLFYRALGPDGVSRIGYASSVDGIHFDRRVPHPVFVPEDFSEAAKHYPYTSPARLVYHTGLYMSGGGWGGCEDPRTVKLEDRVFMTFNIFNGWHSIRVGLTSISADDLDKGKWRWQKYFFLSPVNERHKNWVLFPEKLNGKYALLHNIYDESGAKVQIEYLDKLEEGAVPSLESPDPHLVPSQNVAWHYRTRSVGPPPIKTPYGWLLFYHAMEERDPYRYKLGAMLLDLDNPQKIIYRSNYPILEPDEWYENDWKPGIIYASGAVVLGDTLFIYYGGGDKRINVAYINLYDFVRKLMRNEHIVLSSQVSQVA